MIVVEPGGIKTDWGIIAAENLKKTSAGGAYAEMANKAADGMIKNYGGNMLSKPELIAKTIRKAVTKRRPPYPLSDRFWRKADGLDTQDFWRPGV